MPQCIDDVLKLRPQIETRHLFIGAVTSNETKQHIGTLSQRDRDEILNFALEHLLGTPGPVSGRLGTNNFAIISNQDIPGVLAVSSDQIEGLINELLNRARTKL
jgi:hypothetical protein